MKYQINYTTLFYHFFCKTLPLSFVLYFSSIFLITIGVLRFNGMNFTEITFSLGRSKITDYSTTFGIFACYILIYSIIYFWYARKNSIGEHTLKIEGDFFIWEGKKQQIKTKLKSVKKLVITRKHFSVKFDGLKKATIYKNWSIEGFDEFTKELKKKVQEFNGKIIEK